MAITRDERQALGIAKWKASQGRAIHLYPTGFGKTRLALRIMERYKAQKPDPRFIIVVPHKQLQQQWIIETSKFNLLQYCEILVVNTVVTKEFDKTFDIFIADEVHSYVSDVNIQIFNKLKYKFFLGLTATLSRLDGKERKLLKHFPIADEITVEEAVANKWISDFKQYKVEINVDLDEYQEYHQAFLHHFSYFDYDLDIGIKCLSDKDVLEQFCHSTGRDQVETMIHAVGLMRYMSARKNFCYNHPSKISVANQIIRNRLPNNKIITFTKTVDHAKEVCCGPVYHGKLGKKTKERILTTFNNEPTGVLNTAKAIDVGADLKDVTVGIILSGDSSTITKKQRNGRALRYAEDKTAELWQFVIKGTTEEKWFEKANGGTDFITIQDHELEAFLDTGILPKKESSFSFTLL